MPKSFLDLANAWRAQGAEAGIEAIANAFADDLEELVRQWNEQVSAPLTGMSLGPLYEAAVLADKYAIRRDILGTLKEKK